jgi:hypothetical protein
MGKITTFGRLVIILLILGGVYVGLKYTGILDKLASQNKHSDEEQIEVVMPEPEDEIKSSESEITTNETQSPSFTYTPPSPTGGKLKGVVELGATGFNSFIINIDQSKNWELKNAEFGNSLVLENMATELDVREGLKKYISGMLDFGVAGRDIHFVVSSGAQRAENIQKIIDALKTLNYYVNPVTAEKEGELALKCVLPQTYKDKAFVVDIGSGNTKISWIEGEKVQALSTHGSKYFQEGVSDQTVYTDAFAQANQVADNNRKTCFVIGGVPYELAKQIRKNKERYTVLNVPDSYKPEKAKDKAGVNIYKAVADATGCKTFVFDWDANFTIGFLIELPN